MITSFAMPMAGLSLSHTYNRSYIHITNLIYFVARFI